MFNLFNVYLCKLVEQESRESSMCASKLKKGVKAKLSAVDLATCAVTSAKCKAKMPAKANGARKATENRMTKRREELESRLKRMHLTEDAGRPNNSHLLYEGDTRKGIDLSQWASDVEAKTRVSRENDEWPISLT